MKYLITGGSGFIGSHLVTKLVREGHEVRVLDDLSSGDVRNLDVVKHLITFKVGSVSHLPTVQYLSKNVDVVFHLATQCLMMGMDNPGFLHEVNDVGTFNVCLAAKENNFKIVYIGTSEEYGIQETFPIKEDAPLKPESLYALTKIVGEHYVKFFQDTYNVPAVIIRPFNTFGPLQREDLDMERLMKGFNAYSGVITSFVKRLEKKESPVIFGDGCQSRDFTYVSDIVDGMILLSKLEHCETVNIGYGRDVSVLELNSLLQNMWFKGTERLPIIFAPARIRDIRRLLPDITLAKSYGYEPKVTPEEGLRKYVEWWKQKAC
jgi:UDP-glucose 4-epimerase